MKIRLKGVCAICLSALVGLTATACTKESSTTGNMIYKVALNTQKIALNDDISLLEDGAINVSSAKGEYDSGQFIVKCDEAVGSYDVTVSDLVCKDAVIPKDNIEVCKQVYTYCKEGAMFTGVYPSGYYPDALIPVKYIKQAGEDKIEKDTNQGFWLNIFTPEDAVCGTYSGTVTITYNGDGTLVVPLNLTVFDFCIDKSENFRFQSCFLIWDSDSGWLSYGELTASDEKYLDYYDKLLEYNACAYKLPDKTPEIWVNHVRHYYDRVASFGIPYAALSRTQNDWDYMERYMSALLDACVEDEKDYFSKAYYYLDMFYDEYSHDSPAVSWRKELVRPTIEGCDALEEKIINDAISRKNVSADCPYFVGLRGLRHAITGVWDEEFADLFNFCSPGFTALQYTSQVEEAARLTEEKDVKWWSYGTIGMDAYPSPGWEINDNVISIRDLVWSDYVNNVTGTMSWCVTGFCNWSYYIPELDAYEKIQDLYTVASHEGKSNGDGYLFYPGAPYGSEKPFASLRLAAYRDGVDDHMYMTKLNDKYKALANGYGTSGNAGNFIRFLNEQITARQASRLNHEGLAAARRNLANAIVMADKYGLFVDDVSVKGNEIEYSVYANADVKIEINGTEPIGAESGTGKRYTGKVNIAKDCGFDIKASYAQDGSELNLTSVPAGKTVTSFEDLSSLGNIYLPYGADTCELTDTAFGKSAKVELHGRIGSDMIVRTFKPCVMFDMTGWKVLPADIRSIEFDVYNAGNADTEFTVFFETSAGQSFEYDKVVLKANEWRKIVVNNLKIVSLDEKILNGLVRVGIRCCNLLDGNIQPTSLPLYFDNLFVREN